MSKPALAFLMPQNQRLSWRYLSLLQHCTPIAGQAAICRHFTHARYAIYDALDSLSLSAGDKALLPAFICSTAVAPFTARGVEVDFYNTGPSCEADLDHLEARLSPRVRAVMAVHYFGFPQAMTSLRKLCDTRGIALIEDCAHVLKGEVDGQPMGAFGDVSVFSWRKHLPLFDGGSLVANRSILSPRDAPRRQSPVKNLRAVKGTLGLLGRRTGAWGRGPVPLNGQGDCCIRSFDTPSESPAVSFIPQNAKTPISSLSRWLLTHSDFSTVQKRRRNNYLFLLDNLPRLPGVSPLFETLLPAVCPWVFPLWITKIRHAHRLLRRAGIPAVAWEGVRPASVLPGAFPEADRLYDYLIFLPVHQSLEERDLVLIVQGVRSICNMI